MNKANKRWIANPRSNRLVNIALRSMTMGSKFILIFFLARFLEPTALGLYGLLTATISYALYLVGFDFYAFTTRELPKRDRNEWGALLKNQATFSCTLFALVMPLVALVFYQGILPWYLAGWFFILLMLEHVTQELGRLLIAVSEQVVASLVLFLRAGVWSVAVVALMFYKPGTRDLVYVMGAWTLGGITALLLGVYHISKWKIGGWQKQVDWKWIVKGLKIAFPLLISTLAIRGIFTLDRYWFESLASLETLGAYVLFMGISNAIMAFLDAGVFAFSYPSLISAHSRKDASAYRQIQRKLLIQTLALSVAIGLAALLLIGPVLKLLGQPLYIEQQYLFPWILLATILYAIGMVPHYALYSQSLDRQIIQSHIASFIIFIPSVWLFSLRWPSLAVPLGLCVAFTLTLCWKFSAFFLLTPAQYR